MSQSSREVTVESQRWWGGALMISLLDGLEFLAKHSFLPRRSIVLSDATADAIAVKLARQVYARREGLTADEFYQGSIEHINGVAETRRETAGGLVP